MVYFVQHRLYERQIPLRYLPLLRQLDTFLDRVLELRARGEGADAEAWQADLEEVRRRHDALMEATREGLPPSEDPIGEHRANMAFAAAALRLAHYRDTVERGTPVLDTLGSQTLGDFELDLDDGAEQRARLRRAVARAFALDAGQVAGLEQELSDELEALELRHAIVDGLGAVEPIPTEGGEAQAAAIKRLFDRLYPDNPLRAGDVGIVRTGTSVFFGVAWEGEVLAVEGFGERPEAERAAVAGFIQRITRFKTRYYAHFPVFGAFEGSDCDAALLDALAASTGAERERVARTLTTMVSILPALEVDKYIVHDVWGHQWQALLYRFEETYQQVADYVRLPDLDARAKEGGSTLGEVLSAAVAAHAHGQAIDMGAWDSFLRAELERRLIHAMSGLYAEVLADAVEYKLLVVRPERAGFLMSSSFFKELPTKLDLTLVDLPWYFKLATQGFFRFAERGEVRAALAEAYITSCARVDVDVVTDVVDILAERTASWLDEVYRRKVVYDPAEHGVYLNVFARVALNFLGMQAVMNALYAELQEAAPRAEEGVLRHFPDLLVFAAASFFEADRARNFWHVDEFLAHHFLRCWTELQAALAA